MEEIHVAFNNAQFASLEMGLQERGVYENFRDFRLLEFHHFLTCGDVSQVPFSNQEVLIHHYLSAEWAFRFNAYFTNILMRFPHTAPVKLWVDFRDADEVLNVCYFASLFVPFERVELVRTDRPVKARDAAQRIKAYRESAERLSAADLTAYSARWEAARRENRAIRYLKEGEIVSADADFFEEFILDCVTDRFCTRNGIYDKAHRAALKKGGMWLDADVFDETLLRLVERGAVIPRLPFGWGEHDFMFIQDGFKKPRPPKPVTQA